MNLEQVKLEFKECHAGWIPFAVSVGVRTVKCHASELYDPFPSMVAWLESIAAGAEACAFKMDEEGVEKEFKTFGRGDGSIRFLIKDAKNGRVLLEAVVDARQCVGAFYQSLRAFVNSPAYVPRQWEDQSMGNKIRGYGGCHLQTLVSEKIERWLKL